MLMDSSRQLPVREDLHHVDGKVSKSTEFTREKNSFLGVARGIFFFFITANARRKKILKLTYF